MKENKMTIQQGVAELAQEVRNAEDAGLRLVVVPTDSARLTVDYVTLLENASRAQRTDLSECNFDAPVAAATEQAIPEGYALVPEDMLSLKMIEAGEAVIAREKWEWNELWDALLAAAPAAPLATPADAGAGLTDDELDTALTVFDMGLGFALCHRDFSDTRAAIKELQKNFTAIRAMLAARQSPAPVTTEPAQSIDTPEFRRLITELQAAHSSKSSGRAWTNLIAHIDSKITAPADRDALNSKRWQFMMRIADNEEGPEFQAMQDANGGDDEFDDARPKSVQLEELADAAMAKCGFQPAASVRAADAAETRDVKGGE